MTALRLTGPGEAADLAAFLTRLLHWDKAAVVRLQAAGPALAAFGHPPFGPVRAMAHAAGAAPTAADERPALFACGPWLRLRTAYGSVAVRTSGEAAGLRFSVTPLA